MRIQKLDIAFKLTGDAIPPIETQTPQSITGVLTQAGLMPNRFDGMGVFECEWVNSRNFAFEGVFDAGQWGFERTYLEFEWLRGCGRVILNGVELGQFQSGNAVLDATSGISLGANDLRIEFEKGQERGIVGGIRLRGCWSLHLRSMCLEVCGTGILVRTRVSAHAAGRYVFRYNVSQSDNAVGTFEFEHNCRAKCTEFADTLPITQTDVYRVMLRIMRAGDECDSCEGWVCIPAATDINCNHPAIEISDGEAMPERLELLLQSGIRNFYIHENAFLPEAFLRAADDVDAHVFTSCIPHTPHACIYPLPESHPAFTGIIGMRAVSTPSRPIPHPALYALAADELPDNGSAVLCSASAFGDIARYARAVRYMQAQKVMRMADSNQLMLNLGGDFCQLVSYDIFDADKPRPAYYALRHALESTYAYAEFEDRAFEPGEKITAHILIRGDRMEYVTATVFGMNGHSICSETFTDCAPGDAGQIDFTPETDTRILLLRVSGHRNDDKGACVRDYPIIIGDMAACDVLMLLAPATVKRSDKLYENTSDIIALGPLRTDGGSAMLPGEICALYSAEGVNVFEYDATHA